MGWSYQPLVGEDMRIPRLAFLVTALACATLVDYAAALGATITGVACAEKDGDNKDFIKVDGGESTLSFYESDTDNYAVVWRLALAAAKQKKKVTVTITNGKVDGFKVVRSSTQTAGGT